MVEREVIVTDREPGRRGGGFGTALAWLIGLLVVAAVVVIVVFAVSDDDSDGGEQAPGDGTGS